MFGQTTGTTGQFSDAQEWNQQIYYSSIRVADVNGDNLDDICGRGPAGIYCALNKGNGIFGPMTLWTSQFSDADGWSLPQYGSTIQFADINGDGKKDVCGRGGAGMYCALSNGSSFGAYVGPINGAFSDAGDWESPAYYVSIRLADVNGDGKIDVCGRGPAGIYCTLGNGDGTFEPAVLWTNLFSDADGWNQAPAAATIQFGDLNGDGNADICGLGGAGIYCALSMSTKTGLTGILTGISLVLIRLSLTLLFGGTSRPTTARFECMM